MAWTDLRYMFDCTCDQSFTIVKEIWKVMGFGTQLHHSRAFCCTRLYLLSTLCRSQIHEITSNPLISSWGSLLYRRCDNLRYEMARTFLQEHVRQLGPIAQHFPCLCRIWISDRMVRKHQGLPRTNHSPMPLQQMSPMIYHLSIHSEIATLGFWGFGAPMGIRKRLQT